MSNTLGCDLSHFQTVASFHEIAEKCGFLYLKATEGTGFADPTFPDYRTRAASVGLRVGAYHFLHPIYSAMAQANFFAHVLGDLKPHELAPAIDVESTPGWTREGIAVVDGFAQLMLQRYGECKIYASPGWWASTFEGVDWDSYPHVAACDLWVAEYNIAAPKVMEPFKNWQLWQSDQYGTLPGVEGSRNVDLDIWNGALPA